MLNINNPYFEQLVGLIYPTELQLNKENSSDTEVPYCLRFVIVVFPDHTNLLFLYLNLSITNGIFFS